MPSNLHKERVMPYEHNGSSYFIVSNFCGSVVSDISCPLVFRKRVMPMSTMEVLTLLLVIFAALSYIDKRNKKK